MNEPLFESVKTVDARSFVATMFALGASTVNNVDEWIKLCQLFLILVTIGYTIHRWLRSRRKESEYNLERDNRRYPQHHRPIRPPYDIEEEGE